VLASRAVTGRATLVLVVALLVTGAAAAHGARGVPRIVFPVVGSASYYDDFGEPRGTGVHHGIDILAPRKAIAVAAEAGTIELWTTSASAGCMLYLHGASGTDYQYIHLNNDVGKGDDNRGSCTAGTAYAPGLVDGAEVAAGQPVGFVGDSGDANGMHPHLHFEMHPARGAATDPFPYLNRAQHLLFSAAPGSTVTLSLTGAVASASPDALTVSVRAVKVFPDGGSAKLAGQPVTLSLPVGLDGPSDLAGRHVVVLSAPFAASLDTQLGRGLTAARVALVSGS
jgi:peptidoglycan LD-endopeptidase LytH